MSLTPHIDELACAGHGDCALIAPDVFAVDEIATVIGRGDDELLRKAVRGCPAGAIVLFNDQTGEEDQS
jgi:ferredoxin